MLLTGQVMIHSLSQLSVHIMVAYPQVSNVLEEDLETLLDDSVSRKTTQNLQLIILLK